LPSSERLTIQGDLVWTGDYNGIVNGEFGERAVAAVKAFQRRNATKETGVLNPQEREVLAAAARSKREAAGWRVIDDEASGARLGVPLKLVPQRTAGKSGTRWASARGEVQVETFQIKPIDSLAAAFEQQKREPPGRQVEYSVLRPDFFVLSGLQGLKKYYVRGHVRDGEVRGVTILNDQAMDGIMQPVIVAISNSFTPFPDNALAANPPQRRKVEYASGIVISPQGHVLTDRQAVDGCHVITIAGLGDAERLADDEASALALLRVYGARNLLALVLAGEEGPRSETTLVGIADPQAQGGAAAVSTMRARLGAVTGSVRALEPVPAVGFAGAAALDAQGRLIGMATMRAAIVAGSAPAAAQAALVPAGTIRAFLQRVHVTPAGAGRAGDPKSSIVRVICVRK
jgi:hypothetical protein